MPVGGRHPNDAVANQWSVGRKPTQPIQLLLDACAEQIQCHVDGRPLSSDIVLDEREQAFVARVDLRREGDQDHVEIERRQIERVTQPFEPRPGDPFRCEEATREAERAQQWRDGQAVQAGVSIRRFDVESAKHVARAVGAEQRLDDVRRGGEPGIEQPQRGENDRGCRAGHFDATI